MDIPEKYQAKNILHYLCRLAEVDKNIDPKEELFLKDAGLHLGLEDHEIDEVIWSEHNEDFSIPPSELDRLRILYYTLFLMNIDKNIAQSEILFIQKTGFKLGFSELLTQDLINVMINHVGKELPPDALKEQIIKYLN